MYLRRAIPLNRADRPERFGIGLLRVGQHLAGWRIFNGLAITKHFDLICHLGHHSQIMGDVNGAG